MLERINCLKYGGSDDLTIDKEVLALSYTITKYDSSKAIDTTAVRALVAP